MGQAHWYLSRGTGLVSLLLLTSTVVLGALHSGRASTGAWPRFALHAVHRNLALLTVAFLGVHLSTAIIDPYAGITRLDTVLPFGASYHPFWLGLGATALDLLIAGVFENPISGCRWQERSRTPSIPRYSLRLVS
ncbi:hypothetical protein [Pseudonocardia sp. GCM10023141]|uniref:hypothetical protein n=1 Tax=Pseudonocardia sp. GCM10023141 TaxID=3252653 RepID=UPI00360B8EEB